MCVLPFKAFIYRQCCRLLCDHCIGLVKSTYNEAHLDVGGVGDFADLVRGTEVTEADFQLFIKFICEVNVCMQAHMGRVWVCVDVMHWQCVVPLTK